MKTHENQIGYTVVPFARFRHQMIDWMELMHRQHTVHALLEVDVTDARTAIRESRAATGGPLSFTAFIVASLDHDVIDGAPAARFAARFKEIIESGAILARNREETHKIQSPPDRQPMWGTVGFTVVEERQATGT